MSTLNTVNITNGTDSITVEGAVKGSAKAWVNFNGTGVVAIRASYNVSSITDNGTGNYTVNFTTAMPDANYACSGYCEANSLTGNWPFVFGTNGAQGSSSSVGIQTRNDAGTSVDCPTVAIHIFR